jgi:hypothetical protein
MKSIPDRLQAILQSIRESEQYFNRPKNSVKLLAVSKKQSVDSIKQAYESGQRAFGENYLQEAMGKIHHFTEEEISWHFIGKIQSNKTLAIAENFDWVHTIEREKIAFRLNEHRAKMKKVLNVLIQVNISGEKSKSGVSLEAFPKLIACITDFRWLRLRGVMGMPAQYDSFKLQYESFVPLVEAINLHRYKFDSLSIGTSQDYKAAIAVGSTMVRIGEGLFGPRQS